MMENRILNSVKHNKAALVLIVVGVAIAALSWQFRLRFPFDDTFITFRYAQHLAQGLGFVWNVGGEHTEGYTNFLYIVLLSPSFWLNIDPLVYTQLLNLIAVILSAIYIFELTLLLIRSEFHSENTLFSLVASIMFLCTPLVWINALSGMETTVFGLGILATFYAFAWSYYNDERSLIYAIPFLLAFVTALIRPEGALLGGIIWIVLLLFRKENRAKATKQFLLFNLLPLLVYHAWRYFYFGGLFPNSFLIKVTNPALDASKFLHGRAYVRIFFESVIGLIIATSGLIYVLKSLRVTASLIHWTLAVTAFYLLPEPLMGFYDRFLYSVEFVLFVLAGVGLYGILAGRSKNLVSFGVIAFGIVNVLCALHSPRSIEAIASNLDVVNERYEEAAKILKRLPNHDKISLATSEAGIIPLVSGVEHIDLVGLNTNPIAGASTYEAVLSFVARNNPDTILLSVLPKSGLDTNCTFILRTNHGPMGPHYASFVTDPSFSNYWKLCLLHFIYCDVVVLDNIYSPRAREIEAAFRSRIATEPDLISMPPDCLQ